MSKVAGTADSTFVALLKGINVGGHNKLPMIDLRSLFESLGYRKVQTFIQSGNVIFQSAKLPSQSEIESKILAKFGISTSVVLRDSKELAMVITRNPFLTDDPSHLHVAFASEQFDEKGASSAGHGRFTPEQFVIAEREVYLYLPSGMANAKSPAYLNRQLQIPMTVRNWNTVNRIAQLADS